MYKCFIQSSSSITMGTNPAIITMVIFLAMGTVLAIGTKSERSVSDRTYFHTALDISCLKCPPGSYRINHCTLDNPQAECAPCHNGTFQSHYTRAESCESCRPSCKTDREELILNCSATSNNYCVCLSGFYRFSGRDGLCVIHEPCKPGMGVIKTGTPDSNTVCEVCKNGFFSPNESLTQICQPCSNCPEGYKAKSPCPSDKDTECVPENDNETLVIILGIAGGVVVIFLILIAMMCICARRGRGPKVFQQLCNRSDTGSYDSESSPEKTPLSKMETPPHNGMTNGDVVDKPDDLNGLNAVDLPGVVADKILVNLSHDLIDGDWTFFFRLLIVCQSADTLIEESKIDNKGVREQIYKLLKKWKELNKGEAKLDKILEALKQLGKNDLVEKYSPSKSTDV